MSEATQLSVFDAAPLAVEDIRAVGDWDVPSAEAAEKMQKSGRAAADRRAIHEWLRENGPATDDEIRDGAGVGVNSIRARRGELIALGLVYKLDHEGVTIFGNKANRYCLTTAGRKLLVMA